MVTRAKYFICILIAMKDAEQSNASKEPERNAKDAEIQ